MESVDILKYDDKILNRQLEIYRTELENRFNQIIDLYKEESFEKLFKKVFVGEDKEKIIEKAKSMNRFYTPEQEKEYGVVGIKIEIIK